jgi:hypothetical protein
MRGLHLQAGRPLEGNLLCREAGYGKSLKYKKVEKYHSAVLLVSRYLDCY